MLKSVHHHVHSDTEIQESLEKKLSPQINRTLLDNKLVFRRVMPNVGRYLEDGGNRDTAIIINKQGQFNVVDYASGRTFYGINPEQEIFDEYTTYAQHPHYISFSPQNTEHVCTQELSKRSRLVNARLNSSYLPNDVPVLIVMGLGLGFHLRHLLENHTIEHLVIYEPDTDYFRCSAQVLSWKYIFDLAAEKGTRIYLQLDNDARSLVDDVKALQGLLSFDGFYMYRHYNHPNFLHIEQLMTEFSWHDIGDIDLNAYKVIDKKSCFPTWTNSVSLDDWSYENLDFERFSRNLKAFEQYFPEIYGEFSSYEPQEWLPIANGEHKTNSINIKHGVLLNDNKPDLQGKVSLDGYAQQPNKDGLVLGYKGGKLNRYYHYQMAADIQKIIEGADEKPEALPDVVKSIIIFGLGTGYQLDALINSYEVNSLYICEPNPDYFLASLYALDWEKILVALNNSGSRLYLNIGDDGTELFRDLLQQFYNVGAYTLANTFFYQGYFSEELNSSAAQLREQLKVIISMGDYFDHARAGISHIIESVEDNSRFLLSDAYKKLSHVDKHVPVFFVGNGPSLDSAITELKEIQDKCIIVSCGTALQALYRHNIVPDFHAEVEQNRATFDWISRINNFDYLKKITLLACGSVHPDTRALFKNALLAFKEGESSTVSVMEYIAEEKYATLKCAFPTVSNMAVDLFTHLGMQVCYLVGIDLGFIDKDHHHSVSSGYYDKQGKSRYDYAQTNNTGIKVPGNHRHYVYTKYEFKVSKSILEQTINRSAADYYNLSDGAKIEGASPLVSENLLISSSSSDKLSCLKSIQELCFSRLGRDFLEDYKSDSNHSLLVRDLQVLQDKISEDFDTVEKAEMLIEWQRDFVNDSYVKRGSRLFFYLFGTINFINSCLTKALNLKRDDEDLELFHSLMLVWQQYFEILQAELSITPFSLDHTTTFSAQRQRIYILRCLGQPEFSINSKNPDYQTHIIEGYRSLVGVDTDISLLENAKYWVGDVTQRDSEAANVLLCSEKRFFEDAIQASREKTVIFWPEEFELSELQVKNNVQSRLRLAIQSVGLTGTPFLVIPKLCSTKLDSVENFFDMTLLNGLYAYRDSLQSIFYFSHSELDEADLVLCNGDRLCRHPQKLEMVSFAGTKIE